MGRDIPFFTASIAGDFGRRLCVGASGRRLVGRGAGIFGRLVVTLATSVILTLSLRRSSLRGMP